MRHIFSLSLILIATSLLGFAADPTSTRYSNENCQGSLKPYPTPQEVYSYPDSLTPILINHVGRHGSRYPASATHCLAMRRALQTADSIGSITTLGKELLKLTETAISRANGQWGALDSLGMAEQRGIASRMLANYPTLFNNAKINAISSYSPRCVMSMFSFTHQLSRLNNRIELFTASGRSHSVLMRPFDIDASYAEFRNANEWKIPYDEYTKATIPTTALKRVLGDKYPYEQIDAQELALTQYYVIAGMSAMMMQCDASKYFTTEEYNALWSCFNLRQYLQRTATTISTTPAEIASQLLIDLITTTDNATKGDGQYSVILRFGHAETLMPLLSLMRLKGCYYLTNYFDTVARNWQDFNVVPMSANLQIVLFRSNKGDYYIRIDHNEHPIALLPDSDKIYIPWDDAKEHLMRFIPLYYQIM
ncbi:MAG: histidine-type phosphatase [Muribaculaceae bacterium]|nr:histidine-type phosphatase [Muribaculaceae bacterium]